MSKKKLTAKRKKQLLTMFAVAGVMGNAGIAPTMALADTLSPTAETATEQTQANEAKEVIDQTIQNVTEPLVNPTDSTTTTSDSLATTDEATDETTDETTENTQEQAKEQEQATAATAESEGDATNPTAEAPKVAQKANVAATSEITGTWGKLISKGGSFKDGAISYYVKPDLIKADDQVTMNFYDGSGNLLAENQTVSVN